MPGMLIGQLARTTGIGIETVRFYEREGLLPQPARRASGYREYDTDAVARLHLIKQAQRLGFTLREIRELLVLTSDPQATRGEIRSRAQAKIADIDLRIAELRQMRETLVPLVLACDGQGPVDGCPILAAIEPPPEVNSPTDKALVCHHRKFDHER